MIKRKKKKMVVAVSGGFDPLHIGHVRLMQAAKKLGDELVVILNNDHWLRKKKGFVFMPQKERKEVIGALDCVDKVVLTKHPPRPQDMTVCQALQEIKPDVFCNGGDQTAHLNRSHPETLLCKKIGCKRIYNIGRGGKIQSSSWLTKEVAKKIRQT